jgi:hypothetical protein
MRVLRFLCGVLLLPVCVIVTQTLVSLIKVSQPAADTLVAASALALGAGFLLWLFLYFTLPPPVRTYILAHELTHALWGSLMGATVSGIKISRERGSVTLSKSNFFVTLAPYFFPLYTTIVIIGYYALSIFFDMESFHLLWLGLVGLTWGFHFTFTISALMQRQTDIKEYGYVLSYTTIYILNILGIAIWVVTVSAASLEQMAAFMASHTSVTWLAMWKAFKYLAGLILTKFRQ